MAVYKIPQDVEADDKFVGPLSFKQFIYVGIAAVSSYLSFLSVRGRFWPALIFFAPFIIAGGFLGFPWGRDQSTEVWLAARIRFFIKPRVRIWNQSGVIELVTITAPKKIEKIYTNGLSNNEVTSRLSGLATLLDSRGWAVKNMSSDAYSNPLTQQTDGNERLLGMTEIPKQVTESTAGADVLDETSNTTALHFEQMIKDSEQKHHSELINKMHNQIENPSVAPNTEPGQVADFWFLQQGQGTNNTPAPLQNQPAVDPLYTTFQTPALVNPYSQQPQTAQPTNDVSPSLAEQELLQKLHKQQTEPFQPYSHLRTIQPLDDQNNAQNAQQNTEPATVTAPVSPAIMNLANNDDLNIETISREANKSKGLENGNEVVISLH